MHDLATAPPAQIVDHGTGFHRSVVEDHRVLAQLFDELGTASRAALLTRRMQDDSAAARFVEPVQIHLPGPGHEDEQRRGVLPPVAALVGVPRLRVQSCVPFGAGGARTHDDGVGERAQDGEDPLVRRRGDGARPVHRVPVTAPSTVETMLARTQGRAESASWRAPRGASLRSR